MFDDMFLESCKAHVLSKLDSQLNVLSFIGKTDRNAETYIPSRLRDDRSHDVFAVRYN